MLWSIIEGCLISNNLWVCGLVLRGRWNRRLVGNQLRLLWQICGLKKIVSSYWVIQRGSLKFNDVWERHCHGAGHGFDFCTVSDTVPTPYLVFKWPRLLGSISGHIPRNKNRISTTFYLSLATLQNINSFICKQTNFTVEWVDHLFFRIIFLFFCVVCGPIWTIKLRACQWLHSEYTMHYEF